MSPDVFRIPLVYLLAERAPVADEVHVSSCGKALEFGRDRFDRDVGQHEGGAKLLGKHTLIKGQELPSDLNLAAASECTPANGTNRWANDSFE